jgi:hypothetical protein
MRDKEPQGEQNEVRWGRPRLPTNEVRSCRVVTFVTEGELHELREAAEESGNSLSATVHRMLAGCLAQGKKK